MRRWRSAAPPSAVSVRATGHDRLPAKATASLAVQSESCARMWVRKAGNLEYSSLEHRRCCCIVHGVVAVALMVVLLSRPSGLHRIVGHWRDSTIGSYTMTADKRDREDIGRARRQRAGKRWGVERSARDRAARAGGAACGRRRRDRAGRGGVHR